MMRWIEVDRSALAHNARVAARLAGPVPWWAVVKADAYGHGAAATGGIFLKAGARGLAVCYPEEARALARALPGAPLFVMGPVGKGDVRDVLRHRWDVMVDDPGLVRALARGGTPRRPVPVHLKVDLGLGRWGIALKDLGAFLKFMARVRGVRLAGVFAHPGYVPGRNGSAVETALTEFAARLAGLGIVPGRPGGPAVHGADSALLADFPQFRWDAVRVGNLLYGINPTTKTLGLRSPWSPRSVVARLRRASRGETLGYGGGFTVPRALCVATIPVGYAHGLTLEPSGDPEKKYWALVEGVKCPLVGKPGMGHCLIDVTAVPRPRVGATVRLFLRRTAAAGWSRIYR
jgi:alanine racemase